MYAHICVMFVRTIVRACMDKRRGLLTIMMFLNYLTKNCSVFCLPLPPLSSHITQFAVISTGTLYFAGHYAV